MVNIDRRKFFASGATAAVTSAGAFATSTSLADELASNAWDDSADIVVIGSGLGGMCAALEALDCGVKDVLIIEISGWTGGGASLSRGRIHMFGAGTTDESFNKLTQYSCMSDLQHYVFNQLAPTLKWLSEHDGIPMSVETLEDTPTGLMLDENMEDTIWGARHFFDWMQETIEKRGGRFMMKTAAKRIIMNDDQTDVIGLQCVSEDETIINIGTSQIILACGDWKGDEELRVRYLGHESNFAGIIGTPYNTGSGLKMATAVGASLQGSMGQYAGAFMSAMPAKDWYSDRENYESKDYGDEEGAKLWLYATIINHFYSMSDAIWVNRNGKRFCTETIRNEDKYVMDLPQSSFVAIFDSETWDAWTKAAGNGCASTVKDQIDIITSDKVGGKVFQADTIEELADQLNASGIACCKMHKNNLVNTIAEYNAAAEAGTGEDLTPSRPSNCVPLSTPPFYALPLRTAIFSNWGGVAIDTGARVLDSNRQPIRGLYAAFPTAGGLISEVYYGANSCAAITGRLAADSAAQNLGIL